jgi:hypothetical protein
MIAPDRIAVSASQFGVVGFAVEPKDGVARGKTTRLARTGL